MRQLVNGPRFVGNWRHDWTVPSTSALSQARTRLGEAPLKLLFERIAVPMARAGLRVMALDGLLFDVSDTAGPCGPVGPGPPAPPSVASASDVTPGTLLVWHRAWSPRSGPTRTNPVAHPSGMRAVTSCCAWRRRIPPGATAAFKATARSRTPPRRRHHPPDPGRCPPRPRTTPSRHRLANLLRAQAAGLLATDYSTLNTVTLHVPCSSPRNRPVDPTSRSARRGHLAQSRVRNATGYCTKIVCLEPWPGFHHIEVGGRSCAFAAYPCFGASAGLS
jgi:transposase IS4-like protein